jgi:hypothetical protein
MSTPNLPESPENRIAAARRYLAMSITDGKTAANDIRSLLPHAALDPRVNVNFETRLQTIEGALDNLDRELKGHQ